MVASCLTHEVRSDRRWGTSVFGGRENGGAKAVHQLGGDATARARNCLRDKLPIFQHFGYKTIYNYVRRFMKTLKS